MEIADLFGIRQPDVSKMLRGKFRQFSVERLFTVSRFLGQGLLSGVLLRSAAHFPDTNLGEVAGCLRSKRKSKTPAEMRAAIGREVKRRHDRGRY